MFGVGAVGEPRARTAAMLGGAAGLAEPLAAVAVSVRGAGEPGPCGRSAVAHLKPIFCSWALTNAAAAPPSLAPAAAGVCLLQPLSATIPVPGAL